MAYEARLEIGVDSRGAKRDVDGLDDSLGKVERSGDRADKATRRFGRGARSTAVELNRLRHIAIGFVGAIGGAAAVRTIVRASDTYTNLRSQLRLVTDSQEELNRVYEQTFELAQDTRQDFESTAQLYTKLARSTDELNLSNEELLKITRAINQSFIVSGAGAEEAAGAVRQLSQGMASGTLRGDELNSVMENSPRLARAIADQLGVTIGQLRQLGADGEITAEKISAALIGASDDIDREFQSMQRTVGQSLQQLRNDVLNALGPTETLPLVDAIDELRELVSDPTFRQNLVSLTSTLISGFGQAAQAISSYTGELKELGVIDFSSTREELSRINKEIAELEGQSLLESATSGGTILPPLNLALNARRLSTLRKERDRILEELSWSNVSDPFSGMPSEGAGAGGLAPPTGPSKKELKEQGDELDRLIEASVRYSKEISAARKADAEAQKEREEALQSVRESLMTEEESIQASYERRRQIIMDNTLAGSEERLVLETKLAEDRVKQLNEIEDRRLEHQRQVGQDLLNFTAQQLSITTNMLATAGKENTGLYKTLLAVQRAAAIPSMVIATEEAATKALAAFPPPANLALATTIRGLGYASVGIAAGQTFAGLFDNGGNIPAGKWGIAGERGPEIIQGPAQVTSRRETAEMMKGEGVTVNVQNAPPGTQVRERRVDGRQIVDIMVADINGGGSLSKAISGAYGLKRRGR